MRESERETLGGGDSLPLHQVLDLAIQGDPPGQYPVLLPARQAPGRAEVAADGALEVGDLAVDAHAVHYVCGGETGLESQRLCGGAAAAADAGVGGGHLLARRGWDLRVGGLQGPPRSPTFPLDGRLGDGHHRGSGGGDGDGSSMLLLYATEAAGNGNGQTQV